MRAAMLGGAGYVAGKKSQQGSEREADQEARLAALEQQGAAPAPQAPPTPPAAPAPAAPAAGGDVVGRLKELAELRDAGALSDEEFAAAKAQLLGGS